MNYEEYAQYHGPGLAELVAHKEVSPADLLDIAIARTEQVNGTLTAIRQTGQLYG